MKLSLFATALLTFAGVTESVYIASADDQLLQQQQEQQGENLDLAQTQEDWTIQEAKEFGAAVIQEFKAAAYKDRVAHCKDPTDDKCVLFKFQRCDHVVNDDKTGRDYFYSSAKMMDYADQLTRPIRKANQKADQGIVSALTAFITASLEDDDFGNQLQEISDEV